MIQVKAIVNGASGLDKALKKASAVSVKAENDAVRIEGYRLMRLLRKEIRTGAPGGQRFAPLSMIRRTMLARASGRLGADRALAKMARAIGYDVTDKSPFKMEIGFVGPASSATWRKLAKKHQEGFQTGADEQYFRKHNISIREYLAQRGSDVNHSLYGKKKTLRRNVFFLRKSTKQLRTPARPIIEPFWVAHKLEAMRNIRENFRRKMRGERI
jgi:hypothetical protein